MDTELTIAIAQIITGVATFLLVIVLVIQLTKQKEQLQIQHQDAERNLTLNSLSIYQAHYAHTFNSEFAEIYVKRLQGKKAFSEAEWDKFQNWMGSAYGVIVTEWRLGRLNNNPGYYRNRFRRFLDSKAGIEFYEIMGKTMLSRGNFGDNKLNQIVEEIYKELNEGNS
tara:strand:+ start:2659 stop:3162 length:504 start_codon:yes stop_codon:yes gene_type:complete